MAALPPGDLVRQPRALSIKSHAPKTVPVDHSLQMEGRGIMKRPCIPERLLTIAEAATLLNASAKTVRRLIDSGELPVVRVGLRVVRITPEDLRGYITRRRSA